MDNIAKILKGRLQVHDLSASARSAMVLTEAQRYFSGLAPQGESAFKPKIFKNGILWIEVSHPAFAQEFIFIKPKVLRHFQSVFGENIFKDIRTKNI